MQNISGTRGFISKIIGVRRRWLRYPGMLRFAAILLTLTLILTFKRRKQEVLVAV